MNRLLSFVNFIIAYIIHRAAMTKSVKAHAPVNSCSTPICYDHCLMVCVYMGSNPLPAFALTCFLVKKTYKLSK